MSILDYPATSRRKRAVLVTGGAAGLARGIVLALARDYDVAFTFRPGGTAPTQTLEELRRHGLAAQSFGLDFLDAEESVASSLAQIAAQVQPDILVHAVGPMTIRRFEKSSPADYHAMVDGNLRSSVQAAAAVLPLMRARKFGRLVFFGLNGSHVTAPARGLALHAAAKAGVLAFARCLAIEEGPAGITVNAIEPGDIREKYRSRTQARALKGNNPAGRPGTWEDVADAVLFLVRDDADFVNGAVLAVGGGLAGVYERNAQRP
ncbi:MAG: acetoacetyl-CoA reductase [Vulcanimicrobiaceae bacterium]